jgi:hypothetical protein
MDLEVLKKELEKNKNIKRKLPTNIEKSYLPTKEELITAKKEAKKETKEEVKVKRIEDLDECNRKYSECYGEMIANDKEIAKLETYRNKLIELGQIAIVFPDEIREINNAKTIAELESLRERYEDINSLRDRIESAIKKLQFRELKNNPSIDFKRSYDTVKKEIEKYNSNIERVKDCPKYEQFLIDLKKPELVKRLRLVVSENLGRGKLEDFNKKIDNILTDNVKRDIPDKEGIKNFRKSLGECFESQKTKNDLTDEINNKVPAIIRKNIGSNLEKTPFETLQLYKAAITGIKTGRKGLLEAFIYMLPEKYSPESDPRNGILSEIYEMYEGAKNKFGRRRLFSTRRFLFRRSRKKHNKSNKNRKKKKTNRKSYK